MFWDFQQNTLFLYLCLKKPVEGEGSQIISLATLHVLCVHFVIFSQVVRNVNTYLCM